MFNCYVQQVVGIYLYVHLYEKNPVISKTNDAPCWNTGTENEEERKQRC